MPDITYVGPFGEVEVPGLGVVTRGESTPCGDELAASLLEQVDNWQPAKAKPVKKEN